MPNHAEERTTVAAYRRSHHFESREGLPGCDDCAGAGWILDPDTVATKHTPLGTEVAWVAHSCSCATGKAPKRWEYRHRYSPGAPIEAAPPFLMTRFREPVRTPSGQWVMVHPSEVDDFLASLEDTAA